MLRLGVAWYRRSLRLLPRWLREQTGPDMVVAFREAQAEALRVGGTPALLALWAREVFGLVRTSWAARRPDGWARRTDPHSDPPHRPTMDNVTSDVRFALRSFARRPGVLLLAVLTLSLGIGSSTAMFTVIDSVLLKPLDYPEPEELHAVYPAWPELVDHPTLGDLAMRGTWSWPELWLVDEQQDVFDAFAGFSSGQVTLSPDDGRPERIAAGSATWRLFPMLGAETRLGRLFDEADGRDGREVALLSFATWRDRYGSDPGVLDRTLRLNGTSYQIVGVLAEGFEVTGVRASVWLPRTGSSTDEGMSNHGSTRALARLAPGVTKERAKDEVARILRTLPPEHGVHDATVEPFQDELTRDVKPVLAVMLAAAGLLLLVACGNVAAILIGAGIDRELELAVRGAIGATRGRLTQQLLTESALLALAGAVGGMLVASLTTRGLAFLAPPGIPRLEDVTVDGSVLAFAVGLSVACGVVFGLIPALSLSSTDLAGSMGATRTTGGKRARLQSTVVVTELAMATVLLVGGVLLARTVSALNRVDTGFDHERLVTMSLALSSGRFDSGDEDADRAAFRAYEQEIVEAVAALPQVAGVEQVSSPPFFDWRGNNFVLPEGWPEPDNPPIAERRLASDGYLTFMGIPILEGRDLERSDLDEGAEPVVVVSRGLAELAWPGESAIGRKIDHWVEGARVVGVAGDIRDEQLDATTELAYYAPITPFMGPGAPLVIRTSTEDAASLVPAIRERVWSVDPDVPITRIATTEELMAGRLSDQVYRARLMTVFATLAGLFALLGIYGVTSRSVARRTREMGLRVALGADRARVHGLVTLQAVRLSAYGVGLGLIASVALGGVLEDFLWGVTRNDPLTLLVVGLSLPLCAALAALPPARRATRVDPLEALKAE